MFEIIRYYEKFVGPLKRMGIKLLKTIEYYTYFSLYDNMIKPRFWRQYCLDKLWTEIRLCDGVEFIA